MTAVDPDPLPVDDGDGDVDPELAHGRRERAEQGLPPTFEIEIWY